MERIVYITIFYTFLPFLSLSKHIDQSLLEIINKSVNYHLQQMFTQQLTCEATLLAQNGKI